jgi:uncharacterized membrane protein
MMTDLPLTLPLAIHLAAVVPAVSLGVYQLLAAKGTRPHRWMGRLWVLLMVVVAVSSFWILDIRKGAGYSVIHLLSLWTLVALFCAVWAIRQGNVRRHRNFMVGTLLGLVGAGAGALLPGRLLSQLLF